MKTSVIRASAAEVRTGGCFCGGVKYSVTGSPINVRVCHCRDCQRLTGSAYFVRALFLKVSISITGKLEEIRSGADLTRKFCPCCGSQIFAERKSNPDAIAVALGSFDDLKGIHPTEHVWVADKQKWLTLPPGSKQHEEMPTH